MCNEDATKSNPLGKRSASPSQIASANRSIAENRDKHKARQAVAGALRSGKLVKGSCAAGGYCVGRIEAHHGAGYAEPLNVTWLCRRHHLELHRRMREGMAA